MREDLLIVLCHSPHDHQATLRLVPPLSTRQASAVYAAMLMDTECKAHSLTRADAWFLCSGTPSSVLCELLSPGAQVVSQGAARLGERLEDAFRRGFDAGYQRVAVIGIQTPDLPAAYLATAFDRLRDDPDLAALGQSLDGGVYLAGLARYRNEMFDGVPWDDPATWLAVRAAASRAHIPLAILPRWQTVETYSDLQDCLARNGAANLTCLNEHGLLRICETT